MKDWESLLDWESRERERGILKDLFEQERKVATKSPEIVVGNHGEINFRDRPPRAKQYDIFLFSSIRPKIAPSCRFQVKFGLNERFRLFPESIAQSKLTFATNKFQNVTRFRIDIPYFRVLTKMERGGIECKQIRFCASRWKNECFSEASILQGFRILRAEQIRRCISPWNSNFPRQDYKLEPKWNRVEHGMEQNGTLWDINGTKGLVQLPGGSLTLPCVGPLFTPVIFAWGLSDPRIPRIPGKLSSPGILPLCFRRVFQECVRGKKALIGGKTRVLKWHKKLRSYYFLPLALLGPFSLAFSHEMSRQSPILSNLDLVIQFICANHTWETSHFSANSILYQNVMNSPRAAGNTEPR